MATLSPGLLNDVRVLSLRCFAAVVETQSFSSAARQLGLSASAVTKHIRALERALEVALFHRTTRRVSVTEAGEQLFDSCLLILAQIDSATGALVEESRLEGHLRVVAPPAFGTSILGPSMPEFLAEHPKLSIDVFLSSGTPDLIRDRLDLGLTIRDEPESKLPHLFLGECPRVLCASPAYLKEHGVPRSLDELQRHDCVASRFSQRAEVWELKSGASTRAVSVPIRMLSDNGEFQRQACLQGAGIGSFYEFHVRRDLEQGSLKRVLANHPPKPQNLFAMLPHREIVRPQAGAFVAFLRRLVARSIGGASRRVRAAAAAALIGVVAGLIAGAPGDAQAQSGQAASSKWRTGLETRLAQAVGCKRAEKVAFRRGSLDGTAFDLVFMSCTADPGSAAWTSAMVAFNDGRKVTEASVYDGVPWVGDARVDVRGDRILYQAVVPRPGDAGCCPTGKAMVTFEPTRLRASAVPQGFQADYPPVKGRRLPEGGAKR